MNEWVKNSVALEVVVNKWHSINLTVNSHPGEIGWWRERKRKRKIKRAVGVHFHFVCVVSKCVNVYTLTPVERGEITSVRTSRDWVSVIVTEITDPSWTMSLAPSPGLVRAISASSSSSIDRHGLEWFKYRFNDDPEWSWNILLSTVWLIVLDVGVNKYDL